MVENFSLPSFAFLSDLEVSGVECLTCDELGLVMSTQVTGGFSTSTVNASKLKDEDFLFKLTEALPFCHQILLSN